MSRSKPAPPARTEAATLPLGTLVLVTWQDASFDLDTEPSLYILRTAGFLIRQSAEVVCIASEADASASYFRAYTAIPAGWVRSIEPLEPA